MQPIEKNFLADIIASPDDDAPRLIYADWLEENGQAERGEFIRVQCELAKYDTMSFAGCAACEVPDEGYQHDDDCPRSPKHCLRRRERELRQEPNRWQWIRDACQGHGPDWLYKLVCDSRPVFCRGFVEEITLPLGDWLTHGPALVQAAPLRVVRLSNCKPLAVPLGWAFRVQDLLHAPTVFLDLLMSVYATEADALAAMSRCCLEYAHGKAAETVQA